MDNFPDIGLINGKICDIIRLMEKSSPDFEKGRALLEENGEKFEAFSTLLAFYNAKFNLTAITEKREVEIKHFLDSLAGEEFFPFGARAAEVGSGAGFPSIPLMIAREDLAFTLIESTKKKCEFLRTAIKELGLSGEVVCGRAEELGREDAFREKFDICCARAVAPMPTLAEYCLPLVRRGGLFLAYKGETAEGGEKAVCAMGGKTEKTINYELPADMGRRNLVLVRKVNHTPARFPRGRGAERKEPII